MKTQNNPGRHLSARRDEKPGYSETDLESALIDKLTHQDLGQMQMYFNHYDRHVKTPDENPTVGMRLFPARFPPCGFRNFQRFSENCPPADTAGR